jgi:quercetin dioxygenase-like cupin family protein
VFGALPGASSRSGRSGTIEFRHGRKKVIAQAGESMTVEPGTVHRFKNVGDDDASFLTRVSPALE